jgi:hypothetical protein
MENEIENQREKPGQMWSLIVGIAILTVGIGVVFGVVLYSNMGYILSGRHIERMEDWTSFVGTWLVVLGAFSVVLALLWRIWKKRW